MEGLCVDSEEKHLHASDIDTVEVDDRARAGLTSRDIAAKRSIGFMTSSGQG
jgi:hypothetical protein